MNDFASALEILEDNNEFLKDYSKGDDEFYQRYSNGFDAIGDLEEYCNKLEKENKLLRSIHKNQMKIIQGERKENEQLEKALNKACSDWEEEVKDCSYLMIKNYICNQKCGLCSKEKRIKLNELLDRYGGYEVDEEKLKEILIDPKPKTVWDLQNGIEYFYINEFGNVYNTTWLHSAADLARREFGNCFLTKEEAEFEVERRKIEEILLKHGGRREYKFDNKNWFFSINHIKALDILWGDFRSYQGAIYFDTEELAKQALAEAGKDNIKKYIFGVDN